MPRKNFKALLKIIEQEQIYFPVSPSFDNGFYLLGTMVFPNRIFQLKTLPLASFLKSYAFAVHKIMINDNWQKQWFLQCCE